MQIYEFSTFISFIGILILAIIPIVKDRRNKMNLWLAAFNFAAALWQLDLFLLYTANSVEAANIISRLLRPFMLLLPYLIFNVAAFVTKTYTQRTVRNIINSLLMMTIFSIAMNSVGLGFRGCMYKEGSGYVPQLDAIYLLYIVMFILGCVGSIILLISSYIDKNLSAIEKNKIKYILLAFTVGVLASFTNLINIWGIDIGLMATFGTLGYFFILSYSILSYDLLDFKALLQRTMLYLVVTGLIFAIYYYTYVLFEEFMRTPMLFSTTFFTLTLAIVLSFEKTLSHINKLTKRVFFIQELDYQELFKELSGRLQKHGDLKDVFENINTFVCSEFNLKSSSFIFRHTDSTIFDIYQDENVHEKLVLKELPLLADFRKFGPLLHINRIYDQFFYLIQDEKYKEQLKKTIDYIKQFNAEIIIFFESDKGYEGVWLIGEKATSEILSNKDLAFFENVTYQLKMKIESEMMKKELLNSEKFATIGKMAGVVAHEIRNPLTGLSTFVQMIQQSQMQDKNMLNKFFDLLPTEFNRLEKLTNDLLTVSSVKSIKLEYVNLKNILSEVVDLLENLTISKSIEIEILVDSLININVDKSKIKQLFINITQNAIQAIENSGTITFTAAPDKRIGKEYLKIAVMDTGKGIGEEDLNEIFKPFYTTRDEGTGLGLAISQNIIKAHGGFFEISSQVNKGTEFNIFIPVL